MSGYGQSRETFSRQGCQTDRPKLKPSSLASVKTNCRKIENCSRPMGGSAFFFSLLFILRRMGKNKCCLLTPDTFDSNNRRFDTTQNETKTTDPMTRKMLAKCNTKRTGLVCMTGT